MKFISGVVCTLVGMALGLLLAFVGFVAGYAMADLSHTREKTSRPNGVYSVK